MQHKAFFNAILNHFSMHPARIEIMIDMIFALIKVGNVQQHKIAQGTKSKVKTTSIVRRIQRFFEKETLDQGAVSKLIYSLFDWGEKITLIMDRTNWKFGIIDINFLVISGIYNNCAIPFFWVLLPHKGNSDYIFRIDLIKQLLNIIPKERINFLLADREFVGHEWFAYLQANGIPFCIRIKENMLIFDTRNGGRIQIKKRFGYIAFGQCRETRQIIQGIDLQIFVTMTKDGELLILAVSDDSDMSDAFQLYSSRWTIETMFKAFKTAGFNFEDTHQKNLDRLSKMMALLAIAYSWSIKIGKIKNLLKPIRLKKIDSKLYPEFSLFGYGFRTMQTILLKGASHVQGKLFKLIDKILLNKPFSKGLANATVVY